MASSNTPIAVIAKPEPETLSKEERAAAMARFWQTVDRIRARNADKDPDEEQAFISEVVEEVRQERYERAQGEASERR